MSEIYIPLTQIIGVKVECVNGVSLRKIVSVDDQPVVLLPFVGGLVQITQSSDVIAIVVKVQF